MAAAERRRKRDMTEETYSRSAMDRAIEAAFRLGFGNALAEVDGDLHPFGHGRRRRCCAACAVLGERDGQVSGRPLSLGCAADCRDSGSRPETPCMP